MMKVPGLILLLLFMFPFARIEAKTPILGTHCIGAEDMYQFVVSRNPDFPREVAEAFCEVGALYGVRGDIALCQAIIETGWFRFDNGTAVTPTPTTIAAWGCASAATGGAPLPTCARGSRP